MDEKDDVWDEIVDIIETCRMNLTDLRELVRTASEVRAAGSCQCGDDESCKFVRQRDELRELVAHMLPWMMRTTPPALIGTARAALEKGSVEPGDGWVRTKDRLPERGEAVLAATKCDGLQVLWVPDDIPVVPVVHANEWVGLGHLSWRLDEVTHWMPLPKLPEVI